jgi:hypothetical protein
MRDVSAEGCWSTNAVHQQLDLTVALGSAPAIASVAASIIAHIMDPPPAELGKMPIMASPLTVGLHTVLSLGAQILPATADRGKRR